MFRQLLNEVFKQDVIEAYDSLDRLAREAQDAAPEIASDLRKAKDILFHVRLSLDGEEG